MNIGKTLKRIEHKIEEIERVRAGINLYNIRESKMVRDPPMRYRGRERDMT